MKKERTKKRNWKQVRIVENRDMFLIAERLMQKKTENQLIDRRQWNFSPSNQVDCYFDNCQVYS